MEKGIKICPSCGAKGNYEYPSNIINVFGNEKYSDCTACRFKNKIIDIIIEEFEEDQTLVKNLSMNRENILMTNPGRIGLFWYASLEENDCILNNEQKQFVNDNIELVKRAVEARENTIDKIPIREEVKCRECGKVESYLIDGKWMNKFPVKSLNPLQPDNLCYNCKYWSHFINMFRLAYEGDEYWQVVLDNIEDLIKRNFNDKKPDPNMFFNMLKDRGIQYTQRDIGIWNMAYDEIDNQKRAPQLATKYYDGNELKQKGLKFLSKVISYI